MRRGDTVLLQAGDLVPADLELLEARGLEVDEWELTGELMPVEKRVDEEAVYVYRGSRITRGSGKGIVVATGEETEYGQILKWPWEQEKRRLPPLMNWQYCIPLVLLLPPFIAALRRYDNDAWICLLCLAAAVVMVLLQNHELFTYLLTTSEARRLEARGMKIRDAACLAVVSHLDIVCLDKTGVLTTLDIEVAGIHFAGDMPDVVSSLPNDERGALIGIGCALCNDVFFLERREQANPIDGALIAFALQHGFDIDQLAVQYKRVYDKPFDSEDRYMAAGFELNDQRLCFAKGDPEIVLRMCTSYMAPSGAETKVDVSFLLSVRTALDAAKQKGDIVLIMACSQRPEMPPQHYTFLCLICLQNPMRPGVRDWVRGLKAEGIRPIMLTGDREETAMTIGRQAGIGLDSGYCLTGKDIARMPLREVARQAAHVSVFARLLPHQKGILVRLLQQRGHSVAMVGDGANDTIALRSADVGISFVENSSPFAKRVSRILVHDLADVLTIITGAKRLEQRLLDLSLFRAITLIFMLLGLYAWMLS